MNVRRTLSHIFALAVRSIRVEETRWHTPLIRGGVSLIVAGIVFIAALDGASIDAPGVALMHFIMWPNLIALTLIAGTVFTSTITEEKENRTLGLLRMADISPLAILFGKVGPKLVSAIVLVLLQIPFVMLAITLGGVTVDDVLRCFASLLLFAVALGSFATLLSVLAPTTGRASLWFVMTFLVLVIVLVVGGFAVYNLPFLVGTGSSSVAIETYVSSVIETISRWTPINTLVSIGMPAAPRNSLGFFTIDQLVVSLVLMGGAFLAAWLLFDRWAMRTPQEGETSWWYQRRLRKKREAAALAPGLSEKLTDTPAVAAPRRDKPSTSATDVATSAARPSKRSWSAAIAWKEFFLLAGGTRSVVIRTALYPIIAFGFATAINNRSDFIEIAGGTLFGIAMFTLPIELIYAASRVFRYELDNQTWSGLVLLPRTLHNLVAAKIGGALFNAVPSFVALLLACLCLPDIAADFVDDVILDDEGILLLLYVLSITALGLALATFFSLFTKYGAIPVALVSLFAVNMLVVLISEAVRGDEAVLFLGTFLNVVVAVFAVEGAVQKLGDLAARGE